MPRVRRNAEGVGARRCCRAGRWRAMGAGTKPASTAPAVRVIISPLLCDYMVGDFLTGEEKELTPSSV